MRALSHWAWVTVGFVFLLMVWGNLVSATGSGLACPDWPLCHGQIIPPITPAVILEWGHRLLALTATTLIVITLIFGFRSQARLMRKAAVGVLALLAVQIVLGGVTVLVGLSLAISTIHLLVATLVFSSLLALAYASSLETRAISPLTPSAGLEKAKRMAVVGLGILLVQLLLGALVRHGHAGLACPSFPACQTSFFPEAWTFETAIAFLHRWWGVLAAGHFIGLGFSAKKKAPALRGWTRLVLIVAIVQVGLGIFTVLSVLSAHVRATHAALGYALWGLTLLTAFRAGFLGNLLGSARSADESRLAQAR